MIIILLRSGLNISSTLCVTFLQTHQHVLGQEVLHAIHSHLPEPRHLPSPPLPSLPPSSLRPLPMLSPPPPHQDSCILHLRAAELLLHLLAPGSSVHEAWHAINVLPSGVLTLNSSGQTSLALPPSPPSLTLPLPSLIPSSSLTVPLSLVHVELQRTSGGLELLLKLRGLQAVSHSSDGGERRSEKEDKERSEEEEKIRTRCWGRCR
eukprot:764986-Hanusia_phi.AAC.1